MRDPTAQEIAVLEILGEAWNQFRRLPIVHGSDLDEFMRAIHSAQNIVAGRPVVELMKLEPAKR